MKPAKVIRSSIVLVATLTFFGYAIWWGYGQATAPVPGPTPEPCMMTDVGAELTPNKVNVRILNGGKVGGLARSTGTYLRAFGFNVIRVNNTDEEIVETTIVGNSANDPEVQLVLGFFPDAKVRPDGRVDHVVDVLLGPRYTQLAKPATAVPVSGPVCLPKPITTPTPTPDKTPSTTPEASAKK